MAKKQFS